MLGARGKSENSADFVQALQLVDEARLERLLRETERANRRAPVETAD
jgi:hypothetical protein